MLVVELDLDILDLILGETCGLECGRESCVLSDVGLCTCLALRLDAAELDVFADEVELIDGKSRKLLKAVGFAIFNNLVNEGSLANGDAVLVCLLYERGVCVGDVLTEHRTVLEQCVDLACKLGLKCVCVIAFNAGDRQQDGVLHIAEISVLEHRTDDGVDRYIKVGVLKIHAFEHLFAVGVKSGCGDDLLILVDLQLNAGVYIERNYGGKGVA